MGSARIKSNSWSLPSVVSLWKSRFPCKEAIGCECDSGRTNGILCRGGASAENDSVESDESEESMTAEGTGTEGDGADEQEWEGSESEKGDDAKNTPPHNGVRIWHTSDILENLVARSAVVVPESVALRQLISQRSKNYIADLKAKRRELQDPTAARNGKLPHPIKVLHYLAPKIPAIKHSPAVNLRIQTARSDIDSGVAACLLGTLGRVCEVYDASMLSLNRQQEEESLSPTQKGHGSKYSDHASAASDLVKDRRFEQVVECLLCGVDVEMRKREYLSHFWDSKKEDGSHPGTDDVEDIIEGEQVQISEGLNIRDACRASWGLAILGAHHCGELGGTRVMDLLMALSLRIRELLLVRLQMFLQRDLMEDLNTVTVDDPKMKQKTLEERVDEMAEEKAEDAAAAMWTFACVRACTGMRSDPLFETCCLILCQDPVELRRRAQEANEDSSVNTIVDMLERSEAEMMEVDASELRNNETAVASEGSHTPDLQEIKKTRTGQDYKEALIDWLSPNELTDVLWALALHGHADVNLREGTVLSETAGALKEIAFDRLMDFLRKDCALVWSRQRHVETTELQSTTEVVTKGGETMTLEVVDAAALLAAERAATTAVDSISQKVVSAQGGRVSQVEEIEVDDNTILLKSTMEIIEDEGDEGLTSITKEVLVHEDDEQPEQLDGVFFDNEDTIVANMSQLSVSASLEAESLFFSPHDLCSLSWAVTELRDSLRFQTVDLVVSIFSGLGEESFDELSGADLSNLAWALARYTNDARPWSSNNENPACFQLTLWVVRRALIASGGSYGQLDGSQTIHVLDPFQPPELSRLIWAVASLVRRYSDEANGHFPEIQELATNALVSASSNLSMFSPEDLVRILWTFLEVSDMDEALAQPSVADALGRVFSTVETSIVRWERGHHSHKHYEEYSAGSRGGFNSLNVLFWRPSLSRHMLDQLIEEYNDLDDDDDNKTRLPRLRDLGIDPATLAKAAGAFAKVTSKHLNMRGSSILTRVTLKLLTSKNGRLLQEFSMGNLIRACEAAAINEAVGRGEDLVVGQFARRFLQLLNEANSTFKSQNITSTSDLQLASASPDEIAILLWSLGELGARHLASDKDRDSAHRKLRLVVEPPLLTDDQICHLSSSSSLKALRGLVSLNTMRSDQRTLVKVLELIEPKMQSMRKECDICELAESLAMIRQALSKENDERQLSSTASVKTTPEDNGLETSNLDSNSTTTVETNESATSDESGNATEHFNNSTPGLSDHETLDQTCARMLSAVARLAAERVANLQAESLCRLLVVYSLLPFQADDLILACEGEVDKRQKLLESAASTASVEDLLRQAAKTAVEANRTVFGWNEDDRSSPIESLKKGLKTLFTKNNETEAEIADEVQKFTHKVGGLLSRVTASVIQVDECMEQIGTASNVHTDTALQRIMEGANFELGRCRELISNYRRIEFSTGRRRSRYDYERGRDIGKRLLSRLIPR